MQKIKAEIHLQSIYDNATLFVSPTRKLCAVVKANAYGHGAEEVVNALQGVADCFAVALIEEALALQTAACGKDILIFTPPLTQEEVLTIAINGWIATVPDLWTARLVAQTVHAFNLSIKVHLKINTGMNRYGMHSELLGRVCNYLLGKKNVTVTGVYSHLYTTDREISEMQRQRFARAVRITKRYFPKALAHLGGTYAALLDERYAFDMVRVGIGLYGYLPTEDPARTLPLKKGMTLHAVTAASRIYTYGGCGYGAESGQNMSKGEKISVCRFGYAEGFLRKKENGADGGENANALCMDVCLRKNGKRRGEWIPILTDAAKTAIEAGTIPYEVLCAATRRAEYVYKYD